MKILAKPVDAIAVFLCGEKPRPYKFRYTQDSGERIAVKVDKVSSVEKTRLAGTEAIVYTCQSEVAGVEKLYQLKYIVKECRWELYKM